MSDTDIRKLTPEEQEKFRDLEERAKRSEDLPMFLRPQAD